MEKWVRFSSQTQSKERVFRAVQYACTLLGYTLQKGGAGAQMLSTINQLEAHLSLSRKLLRLGNSADALESAKRAVHLSDCVLRLCVTVAHLNRAMYFACDNMLWAAKTGLLPKLDQKKWSQRSFRYYLFALILGLTRDLYEIRVLMDRERRSTAKAHLSSSSENGEFLSYPSSSSLAVPAITAGLQQQLCLLSEVLRSNPPLLLDTLKNACDLFIPLDKLGLFTSGPGFVGAFGLASSILSILTILYPWLKLKP